MGVVLGKWLGDMGAVGIIGFIINLMRMPPDISVRLLGASVGCQDLDPWEF